jgi:glucitol operon activator protein
MSTPQFVLVLLIALSLTTGSALLQHKYYARTVRRLASAHNEPGCAIVSGRAKGRRRGAIAVLVLGREDQRIRGAAVMQGASVFARFKNRPDWVGMSARGPLPHCSPRLAAAIADACSRVPGNPVVTGANGTVVAPRRDDGAITTSD